MLEEMKTDFAKLKKNKVLQFATLLDPRFMDKYCGDESETEAWKKQFNDELRQISLPQADAQKDDPPPRKKRKLLSLEEVIKRRRQTSAPAHAAHSSPTQILYEEEFRDYLSIFPMHSDTKPLNFWKEHGAVYPRLQAMAYKYLTPLASSVASERIVSAINFIANKRRSRLKSKKIDMLVFLKCLDDSLWQKVLVKKFIQYN